VSTAGSFLPITGKIYGKPSIMLCSFYIFKFDGFSDDDDEAKKDTWQPMPDKKMSRTEVSWPRYFVYNKSGHLNNPLYVDLCNIIVEVSSWWVWVVPCELRDSLRDVSPDDRRSAD
jgi:hypothetical protein